jgi:hypothetical protein
MQFRLPSKVRNKLISLYGRVIEIIDPNYALRSAYKQRRGRHHSRRSRQQRPESDQHV